MKIQSQANLLIHSSFALMLVFSLLTSVTSQSAEPAEPAVPAENSSSDGRMMEHCEKMMEQRKKMKAETKVQDTALTDLVAKMNLAPEDKKTDLMAAIVTQMVEQRTAMHASKAKMEAEMMEHMMEHMQMGKESMSQCPMMKGMKGSDEKSADAHKAHQKEEN